MKKTHQLISLGEVLGYKYASIDADSIAPEIEKTISDAIKGAAMRSSPDDTALGIMNFPQMIKQDGIELGFDVVRNDTLGFKNISVINLSISPSEKSNLLPKYQPLLEQVQKYLSKYWELFPSVKDGQPISYDRFVLNLRYKP